MHDASVVLKDGRTFCGPIWEWRPQEGWFSIPSDVPTPDGRIYFREVSTAVHKGQRTGPETVEDVCLLTRAKREGWDGA